MEVVYVTAIQFYNITECTEVRMSKIIVKEDFKELTEFEDAIAMYLHRYTTLDHMTNSLLTLHPTSKPFQCYCYILTIRLFSI